MAFQWMSQLELNGADLGTYDLAVAGPSSPPVRVLIPAERWRSAARRNESLLQFFFPDAKSFVELGIGDDQRVIGAAFRNVYLRLAPADPAP